VPFLVYVGVLALGALVEATIGHRLELGGGRPNVVLLLVVTWGLLRGIEEGALAGLLGGLALDLVSGTPFGLHTAILGLLGALGALGGGTHHPGTLGLLSRAVLTTVTYHGAAVLVLQGLGWEMPSFSRLISTLVPTVLINAALSPIVFSLAQRLFRALSGWRQLEVE
jgi:rod shape-determining protein MreD